MHLRYLAPFLIGLALLAPAGAQSVSHARDARGNSVIVIHETRPDVLAARKEQALRDQEARRARNQRERELELARARAQAELRIAESQASLPVGASGRAPGSRPGELPPTAYDHSPKYPSYRNGGIPSFAGAMFWGGGFSGAWGGFPPGGYAPGGYPTGGYAPGLYRPGGYAPGGYRPGGYAPGARPPAAYQPGGCPPPRPRR